MLELISLEYYYLKGIVQELDRRAAKLYEARLARDGSPLTPVVAPVEIERPAIQRTGSGRRK